MQINQVTPFIDASTVYGSTKSLEHDLKISEGGLLKGGLYTDALGV